MLKALLSTFINVQIVIIAYSYFSYQLLFPCQPYLLAYVLNSWIFSGSSVDFRHNIVKDQIERRDFSRVARMLISFLVRVIPFSHILRFEFWGRKNNIYPSNLVESNTHSQSPTPEAVNEEDYVLPCLQRLQQLEKVYEDLNNKPAAIPLEKERMLMDSLDRIKSVEHDLEQTKRVCYVTVTTFSHLIIELLIA